MLNHWATENSKMPWLAMTRASWEAIEWWKFTEFSSEHPRGGYSCSLFPGRIGIWNVGFCRRMKTGGPGENPRSNDEYQYTTQPTWNATSRNRMHATTVRGERSRHCTIPAISHFLWNLLKDSSILKFSKAILGPRLTSSLKSNVTPVEESTVGCNENNQLHNKKYAYFSSVVVHPDF